MFSQDLQSSVRKNVRQVCFLNIRKLSELKLRKVVLRRTIIYPKQNIFAYERNKQKLCRFQNMSLLHSVTQPYLTHVYISGVITKVI
jgi:hypothetical protein